MTGIVVCVWIHPLPRVCKGLKFKDVYKVNSCAPNQSPCRDAAEDGTEIVAAKREEHG